MKRFKPGRIILFALPIILLLTGIALVASAVSFNYQYNRFKVEFASSVAYAQENNSLRAEDRGLSVRVTPRNAAGLYTEVVNSGISKKISELPVREYIRLDFGNGDRMRIWPGNSASLYIDFVTAEGYAISFLTSESGRYEDIERIVSAEGSAGANESWDAGDQ
ncbi:MAG TPA: hypothetical protein DD640_04520 [Clostridiales bacterium]|nr:hypothetical protein [Clostridiales bacterium]